MIKTSEELRYKIEQCNREDGKKGARPYITQNRKNKVQEYTLNVPMKRVKEDIQYKISPDLVPIWWTYFTVEASMLLGYLEEKEAYEQSN